MEPPHYTRPMSDPKHASAADDTRGTDNSDQPIARIHESLTGRWHITDDSLPYLDERGPSYPSKAAAKRAATTMGYRAYC